MATETDVVIIGAGAAGLSAARELTRLGIPFVLVEASYRIGGRAYSEEITPDVWFNLGCTYLVVGPEPERCIDESNPFVDFAVDQSAVIEEYLYVSHCIYNGRPLDAGGAEARQRFYEECDDAIRASVDRGEDVAISELIDTDNPYATPYMDMMTVTAPKELDEASAADFFQKVGEHRNFNTLHGYGNLVALWGGDIEVSLNARVKGIDCSRPGVRASTTRGTIRALCLISSVSSGILAAQHIHLEPRLPDWKTDAIQGGPMGAENKIGVHSTKNMFDPAASVYYQVWSNDSHGAYVDSNLMPTNVVTVFNGGRFSIWMEQQGQETARANGTCNGSGARAARSIDTFQPAARP